MERTTHRGWGAADGFTGVLKRAGAVALVLGAMVATSSELSATSAASIPAGYVRCALQSGSATHTGTTALGVPLLNAPLYAGKVIEAHGFSSTAEIQAQTVDAGTPAPIDVSRPCAVFVTSGSFAGFTFRLTAYSTTGFKVDSRGFELSQLLSPGDTFEVRPLHTLRSLFGSDAASVAFAGAAEASRADQLMIQRDGVWRTYWFTGSMWRRTGSAADAGDDVLLPQDGIVVYRRGLEAAAVRFLGEAPMQDAVISVPAGAVSTVANPFPTPVSLAELGLETASGWICASRMDSADQVQICQANTWKTFWHDGSTWRASTGESCAPTIAPGTALLVVRKPAAAANPYALVERPYSL